MMSLSKNCFCTFLLAFLCVVLDASEYRRCRDAVAHWIYKTYANDPIGRSDEENTLRKIMDASMPQEDKITAMKKKFPAAFQKEEKPLIYTTPLTWKVHSLALGYDISETAASTEKVSDIVEIISNEQSSVQTTKREDNGSSHNIRAGAGIDGQYSFNPMAWLDGTAGTRISISGSYNYGKNWSSQD